MKEKLEILGYDLTDDKGEYCKSVMADIAANIEKFKRDENFEVWTS